MRKTIISQLGCIVIFLMFILLTISNIYKHHAGEFMFNFSLFSLCLFSAITGVSIGNILHAYKNDWEKKHALQKHD